MPPKIRQLAKKILHHPVEINIAISKPPEKSAATAAVIATLAKTIGMAKSSFRLASGETSRDKVVELLQNEIAIRSFLEGLSK